MEEKTNCGEILNNILDLDINFDEKLNKVSEFIDKYGDEFINEKDESEDINNEYQYDEDYEDEYNYDEYYEEEDEEEYEYDEEWDEMCFSYEDDRALAYPKIRKEVEGVFNDYGSDREGLIKYFTDMIIHYNY